MNLHPLLLFFLFYLSPTTHSIFPDSFTTIYQWTYVNFTWKSPEIYHHALTTKRYVPENNVITGLKLHKNNLYLSLPRYRIGTPVTLAYLNPLEHGTKNLLLKPYPSWDMNVEGCGTLQNVLSMEIDTKGVMWVIDGIRVNNFTSCPPKLVLLDLEKSGAIVRSYEFPDDVVKHQGGFLNDIVVDEGDLGDVFAYMSDSSSVDPGLVVYSYKQNTSWKLRDPRMQPDPSAANITIENHNITVMSPINGVALSPLPFPKRKSERTLYFCPLTSFNLYQIGSKTLQNSTLIQTNDWHGKISLTGRKQGQSDGLTMDNSGNLFYTLVSLNGVGRWNIKQNFNRARVIQENERTMVWPNAFAFDNDKGNIYLISNKGYKYVNVNIPLNLTGEVQFRILRKFVGTRSYLYRREFFK